MKRLVLWMSVMDVVEKKNPEFCFGHSDCLTLFEEKLEWAVSLGYYSICKKLSVTHEQLDRSSKTYVNVFVESRSGSALDRFPAVDRFTSCLFKLGSGSAIESR